VSRNHADGPLLNLTTKVNASERANITLDPSGLQDGGGTPSVQDGALYRFDAASNTIKPWNVTVQTLNLMDSLGNPITVTLLVPPP
jgi:hypothetical protein